MATSNKVLFDRTEAERSQPALKRVWDYSECFLLLGLLLTCAELISFAVNKRGWNRAHRR
jgi:hypothetical protein